MTSSEQYWCCPHRSNAAHPNSCRWLLDGAPGIISCILSLSLYLSVIGISEFSIVDRRFSHISLIIYFLLYLCDFQ